jgi:hypothetical protein
MLRRNVLKGPQAAAIYTLKQKHRIRGLRERDNFIICDAGGGTVDLITYRVAKSDPLELVGSVPGTGDVCGSIFLNRKFEAYLEQRLGAYYTQRRSPRLEKALKEVRLKSQVTALSLVNLIKMARCVRNLRKRYVSSMRNIA